MNILITFITDLFTECLTIYIHFQSKHTPPAIWTTMFLLYTVSMYMNMDLVYDINLMQYTFVQWNICYQNVTFLKIIWPIRSCLYDCIITTIFSPLVCAQYYITYFGSFIEFLHFRRKITYIVYHSCRNQEYQLNFNWKLQKICKYCKYTNQWEL